MGQTFSEYLYYETQKDDTSEIFFTEDCLIKNFENPIKYKSELETIYEDKEMTFQEELPDAYSNDYVKKAFLLAKNELDQEKLNKNENFDLLYPLRLTNNQNNLSKQYFDGNSKLKDQYNSLNWEHQILKKKYNTLKKSYEILNKNYDKVKTYNKKYKFD